MMKAEDNWVLKNFVGKFTTLNEITLEDALRKLNIPLDGKLRVIDWTLLKPVFNFFYDEVDAEEEIKNYLMTSAIAKEENVIIDFGPDLPVLKLNTQIFIENWDDFVAANGHMGIIVLSTDGTKVMEFTDDAEWQLFSNFEIKRTS